MSEDRLDPDRTELPSTEAAPAVGGEQRQIGPYRLLQKLGEGGMGEVWLAEQTEPVKRRVALKIIKQGMDTKQVVARFEAERQALAMMDHPAVAKVFDAGTTPHGRPYFVMEHVKGVPITEHCDRHKLTNRERLDLFTQVCEGVQHAHQKAIIHRDLKPSNVLVTEQDGKRLPKIIDFGVAKATAQKLTEKTVYTELGVLIGTPEYMSPEQAELTGEDVDTRTDVYSLGVILYELLVGALPFDSKELRSGGYDGIRKKIREEEPHKPSTRLSTLGNRSTESAKCRRVDLPTLQRQLRGDLDWITMRALEKDRSRRYGSPMDFAADIGRYLADEPVLASPPSAAYRAKKFVRRHRFGVAATAVLVLGLTAGIVGSTVGLIRARRAEARALEEAQRSERVSIFLQEMLSGLSPDRLGNVLRTDLRAQTRNSREALGATEDEIASALGSLDDALVGIYLAESGIRLMDEEILGPVTRRVDKELGDDPVIAARLHHTIGEVNRLLGRNPQASDSLEKALELRRRSLGEDHPDTLKSMLKLALVYHVVGRGEEHLQMATEVAERGLRVLGAEHELTLDALGEVADAYMFGPYDAARVTEAEDQHIALLAVERRALGEEHRQTLYRMDKVAGILKTRGRVEDAEALHRETLEIRSRVLGEEDPATIGSSFNLAVVRWEQGRFAEAEVVFREVLEIGRRRFGELSQLAQFPMINLATMCEQQGRYDEAVNLRRRLLQIGRRSRGEQSPSIVYAKVSLADVLGPQGNRSEAETLYMEALEQARLWEDPILESWSLLGLAQLYVGQGELAKAELHFQRWKELNHGQDSSAIASALAAYLVLAGDFEAATRSLKEAVELGEPRAWIAADPDFAPLRGNPEFEAIIENARQKSAEQR